MGRKKLSLRTPGNGSPDGSFAISEEVAAALVLIEAHGRRAGQALVDEAQAAIKAGDDDRAAFWTGCASLCPRSTSPLRSGLNES